MKLVCRTRRSGWKKGTELLAAKMVEDTNPTRDMVDITGHVVHESVSYDKDVVEIKLPDTVVSSDYGGNFVKDVCIDDGQLPRPKISDEKTVDEKSSPNFDCVMIDANSDPRYGRKDDARKFVQKLKPETVLPVGIAPDGNKQYSSCKEYDPEDRSTADYLAGDLGEKKISLKELLRLENAEESQRKGTISSQSSENHLPHVHGVAVAQVPINDCHGVEAIASNELVNSSVSSQDNTNVCSATTSEEGDATAALDVRGPNQVNHYNPFVGQGSLEDTWKPECSTPAITDAASTEPICIVENTDSFSDLASGSKVFNEVETAEHRVDAPSSSSSDAQSSEKSNDQNCSPASDVVDEAEVATSSSVYNVEPGDANGENHEKKGNDGTTDVHDSNQRDEENCVDTMNDDAVSKSQAQKDNVGEQSASDSAKVTGRIGNSYPFEPCFGPSIMSAPVSNSGHIAYSGNISIRSDSSTTSTRSFAFPVLQRDWISSPARMAKGERRRIRRHRGWRKRLLCCKF